MYNTEKLNDARMAQMIKPGSLPTKMLLGTSWLFGVTPRRQWANLDGDRRARKRPAPHGPEGPAAERDARQADLRRVDARGG